MTTVLGLDLSLTATGWALHPDEDSGTFDVGTIRTVPADPIEHRLNQIITGIGQLLEHRPDLIVIENFVTRSPAASLLGMVHGAVRHWLHTEIDGPWRTLLVPPAALKTYATGKGNANKVAMALALQARTDLQLDDDNQVDATWLTYLGHHTLGQPLLDLPKTHTRALDKLDLDHLAATT